MLCFVCLCVCGCARFLYAIYHLIHPQENLILYQQQRQQLLRRRRRSFGYPSCAFECFDFIHPIFRFIFFNNVGSHAIDGFVFFLKECPSSSWLSCLLVGWVVVFVVPNTSFVWCNCKSYHHHQSYTKKLHVVIILYYTMATNVLVWFWLMINYKTDIVVDIIVRSHSSGYYLINTYVVQKRKKTSTPSIKINLANNPLLFWIYTGNNNDDVDDMILAILMMNVVF